jgi:putative tryptophan/tyrosine transport system substrate-binding protein
MPRFRHIILPMLMLFLIVAGCSTPTAVPSETSTSTTTGTPTQEAAGDASETPTGEVTEEATGATEAATDLPIVGLVKLVSHPALDAEQQGVKDALVAAGFIDGETVRLLEANAEGDIATLTTIAQRFVDEGVALIVATSTPALQAAFNVTQDEQRPPIVFNAVTSPYAAGIAASAEDHWPLSKMHWD